MTGIHLLVVSGSPGIGKSYFLYFVMHNLAMMDPKPTVVLQIRQNPVYCFNNDTVTEGALPDFALCLREPDTWYLVGDVRVKS